MNTAVFKKEMKKQGVTQYYLARRLKISQPAMCQKINNRRSISVKQAEKLAQIMGFDRARAAEIFFSNIVA